AEVKGDWEVVREHTHPFFAGDAPLWRLSVPSTTPPLGFPQLIEWGGALRWMRGVERLREIARRAGGHATLFRGADKSAGAFAPLDPVLMRLHRQLKSAFDPAGILNPGRLYPEF
ncbi:MAG: glycolate oxidase subunit GlcE, partial [Betaproteobacteria bacterium]|nr:glycolate oxidase subunit GlcE [Betaproteobacteria bacterium]